MTAERDRLATAFDRLRAALAELPAGQADAIRRAVAAALERTTASLTDQPTATPEEHR